MVQQDNMPVHTQFNALLAHNKYSNSQIKHMRLSKKKCISERDMN